MDETIPFSIENSGIIVLRIAEQTLCRRRRRRRRKRQHRLAEIRDAVAAPMRRDTPPSAAKWTQLPLVFALPDRTFRGYGRQQTQLIARDMYRTCVGHMRDR